MVGQITATSTYLILGRGACMPGRTWDTNDEDAFFIARNSVPPVAL